MNLHTTSLEKELTFSRFDRMSELYPDRTAILYLGEHFTYRRLRELSERLAGALRSLGVRKGDRVMLYIPNCIQWVIAFLAIQKSGAVLVPIAPIYTSFEIEYMLKDSGAETVICQDTNFGYVKEVSSSTGLKQIIVTNLALLPITDHSQLILGRPARGRCCGSKRAPPGSSNDTLLFPFATWCVRSCSCLWLFSGALRP